MFRRSLFLVLAALGLVWAWGAYAHDPTAGVYKLVMLDAYGRPYGHATGFAVNPTTVVTASHVVEGAAAFLVGDGHRGAALVANGRDFLDLGLVRTSEPLHGPFYRLDCRRAPRGEPVRALGYPLDVDLGEYRGHVASNHPPRGDFPGAQALIVLDLPVSPGISGGPVFDVDGDVVGLISAGAAQPVLGDDRIFSLSATGLMVAGDAICLFLDAWGVDYARR